MTNPSDEVKDMHGSKDGGDGVQDAVSGNSPGDMKAAMEKMMSGFGGLSGGARRGGARRGGRKSRRRRGGLSAAQMTPFALTAALFAKKRMHRRKSRK